MTTASMISAPPARLPLRVTRVLAGGVVAGGVVFAVNGVVNGALLAGAFEQWARDSQGLLHPPGRALSVALWIVMCLVNGLGGTWLYAAIRPRFGAGYRTALLAGLALFAVGRLPMALDLTALGVLPSPLLLAQAAGALFAAVTGTLAGAWLYRE